MEDGSSCIVLEVNNRQRPLELRLAPLGANGLPRPSFHCDEVTGEWRLAPAGWRVWRLVGSASPLQKVRVRTHLAHFGGDAAAAAPRVFI